MQQQPFFARIKTAIKMHFTTQLTHRNSSDLLIIKLFRLKLDIIAPPGNSSFQLVLDLDVTKSGHHHRLKWAKNTSNSSECSQFFHCRRFYDSPRTNFTFKKVKQNALPFMTHLCPGNFLIESRLGPAFSQLRFMSPTEITQNMEIGTLSMFLQQRSTLKKHMSS